MELKDTIKMMGSSDYKERFRAEYWQVKIRFEKLESMIKNGRTGNLILFQCAQRASIACSLM